MRLYARAQGRCAHAIICTSVMLIFAPENILSRRSSTPRARACQKKSKILTAEFIRKAAKDGSLLPKQEVVYVPNDQSPYFKFQLISLSGLYQLNCSAINAFHCATSIAIKFARRN